MKKMSVAEAAEFFSVSKEAIHNRIRRGSLKSLLGKDGVKLVLVDETSRVKIKNGLKSWKMRQEVCVTKKSRCS